MCVVPSRRELRAGQDAHLSKEQRASRFRVACRPLLVFVRLRQRAAMAPAPPSMHTTVVAKPARVPVAGMCRPGSGSYACLSGDRPGEGLPAAPASRLEHPPHPALTAEALEAAEAVHDLPIAAL